MSCCTERYPFDRAGLTYKGKLIYNNEFRRDGLYYYMLSNRPSIIYFFQDGTYCEFSAYPSELLNLPAGDFIDIPDKIRELPYCWGAYIIEGNLLKVQTYDPGRGTKFKVEENWATIENDTTIHVFKRITPRGTEITLDKMLHFRSTLSKPDSTNVLMRE